MKENVLDVLIYLIQNASLDDDPAAYDQDSLKTMLEDAGFAQGDISEAFRWLDDLDYQISQQATIEPAASSVRCFATAETNLLDVNCQNYLLNLVNTGILSANSFELVMDRVIALAEYEITLDQLEWVVLVVLSNQSNEQAAFERLEAMAFTQESIPLN